MQPTPNLLVRPYKSVIPQAIDAIHDAFTACFAAQLAAGGDRVYVRDGLWTAAESGGSWAQDVAVGWYGFYPGYQYPTRALSEEQGEAVITAHNEQSGWAPGQEETFTLGCASFCQAGVEATHLNWSALRTRVYGNIATAAAYIANPPYGQVYLGGLVQKLTIAEETSMHQVASRRGILAIATFTIGCTARSQQ